jgi:hypothetical protein
VAPNELDRSLRRSFRFEAADLVANREGRLSPRQSALVRAGRTGMWLSLAVFTAVMLGSVGMVAFFNWRLDTPGGWGRGDGAAVAVVVIAIGYAVSRQYLSAARSPRLSVVRGLVAVLSDTENDCRVRIGGTTLRLPEAAALDAFCEGTEYRLYYLAAPVAIVLSGEALSSAAAPSSAIRDARLGAGDEPVAIPDVALAKRGYAIVVLLGILALGIPVAGVFVGDLPPRLRPLAWIGLLGVAIGFVWLALSALAPRGRRRS